MKTTPCVQEVRPFTMKELCAIYHVSAKTMRKWLQPFARQIGPRRGHLYTVAQVTTIFDLIGVPGTLE